MVKVEKRETEYYEGNIIQLCCQGCSDGIAETDIKATDKYNQKFTVSLCPECMEELKKQLI